MDENNKIITLGTLSTYNEKKQDLLVSGTNIKTINGQSIVGDGNLEIIDSNPSEFATTEEIMSLFTLSQPEEHTHLQSDEGMSATNACPAYSSTPTCQICGETYPVYKDHVLEYKSLNQITGKELWACKCGNVSEYREHTHETFIDGATAEDFCSYPKKTKTCNICGETYEVYSAHTPAEEATKSGKSVCTRCGATVTVEKLPIIIELEGEDNG